MTVNWQFENFIPTAEEIVDILWLAAYVDITDHDILQQPNSPDLDLDLQQLENSPFLDRSTPEQSSGSQEPHVEVRPQQRESNNLNIDGIRAIPFQSPTATALPGKLSLARSLRPLRYRIPSHTDYVLNEEITADYIAQLRIAVPVLEPDYTRWLELTIIVDEYPSMAIWQDTANEFIELLRQIGVFRTIQICHLVTTPEDDNAAHFRLQTQTSLGHRIRQPKELIQDHGRQLLLILSDCTSPAWSNGDAAQLLANFGSSCMIAIVQMLPETMWATSELSECMSVYVSAAVPGMVNRQLRVELPWYWLRSKMPEGIPIPVVTLEPESLLAWAQMLTGKAGIQIPAIYLPSESREFTSAEDDISVKMTAEERWQQFRATASPKARELAGYFAAVPLNLSVMRIVQKEMLPNSRQVHLAEVFRSGLLKKIDDLAQERDRVTYEFIDNIRGLLLRTVLLSDTQKVFEKVSKHISQNSASWRTFHTLLLDPTSPGDFNLDENTLPIAYVATHVLERLGGDYTELADRLKRHIELISATQRETIQQSSTAHVHRHLRRKLLELYDAPNEIEIVVADAGIQPSRIRWSGSAETVWHDVLIEARKINKVAKIVELASEKYPNHRAQLESLLQNWQEEPPPKPRMREQQYNFDLLLEPLDIMAQPPLFQASVQSVTPWVQIRFPITATLEEILSFHTTFDTRTSKKMVEWGRTLISSLFQNTLRDALRDADRVATNDGSTLRVRLLIAPDPLLREIPWEYLFERAIDNFELGVSPVRLVRTPLVRNRSEATLLQPKRIEPFSIDPLPVVFPLKVLVVVMDPRENVPNKLKQWEAIQKALAEDVPTGNLHLTLLRSRKLDGLRELLKQERYHVLHLISSNSFHTRENNQVLASSLYNYPSLRLVLLTGNLSQRSQIYYPLSALAQRLLNQGIPAVVQAQFFRSAATEVFNATFYRMFLQNVPVDLALTEARIAMLAKGIQETVIPTVHLLADNGLVFRLMSSSESSLPEVTSKSESGDDQMDLIDQRPPETHVTKYYIYTEGGSLVLGDVSAGGNFTGRDATTTENRASPQEKMSPQEDTSQKDEDLPAASATREIEPHEYRWPSLWPKRAPFELPELTNWRRMVDLPYNPFGAEQAEQEPNLARYYIYPEIFERYARGARPAILFGPSGSGKTGAALLLVHDCITPTFSPREESAFPIYCRLEQAQIAEYPTANQLIATAIATGFARFLVLNLYLFVDGSRTQKAAITTCLLHAFGSVEGAINYLYRVGLPDDELGQQFVAELHTFGPLYQPDTMGGADWAQTFVNVRPTTYQHTYLIIDMTEEPNPTAKLEAVASKIQALLNWAIVLSNEQIYLKLFLPDQLQDYLEVNEIPAETMRWTDRDLANMLKSRLTMAGVDDFNQLFDAQSQSLELEKQLIQAAAGSPQRLIRLGNYLLQIHLARSPNTADLNYRDLDAALAAMGANG